MSQPTRRTYFTLHFMCNNCCNPSILSLLYFRTFPLALRRKWLKTLRHHKVKLAISSCAGRVSLDCANTSTAANAGTTTTTCSNNANSGNAAAAVLRPFPARRGGKGSKSRQAEMEAEAEEDNNNNMAVDIEAYSAG